MPSKTIFKNEFLEWIDIEEPSEKDLKALNQNYQINHLLLEDTIDTNHLPKYESYGNFHFFLMRENTAKERKSLNSLSDVSTKLSVFLFENQIITLHRIPSQSIENTLNEIRQLPPEQCTPDRTALSLALKVIKTFDDEAVALLDTLDKLETQIFLSTSTRSNYLRQLYRLKRKAGLNTRVLNTSSDWVEKFKNLKLSEYEITDLKDKYKDVIADFDHLNAQITNLLSLSLALADQKANQVMKILAIYSMYFLPITFIAGLYGMNFDHMPELHHRNGYFVTLGFMAAIVLATFLYVKRKKW